MYSPLRNGLRSMPGSTRASPVPSATGDLSPLPPSPREGSPGHGSFTDTRSGGGGAVSPAPEQREEAAALHEGAGTPGLASVLEGWDLGSGGGQGSSAGRKQGAVQQQQQEEQQQPLSRKAERYAGRPSTSTFNTDDNDLPFHPGATPLPAASVAVTAATAPTTTTTTAATATTPPSSCSAVLQGSVTAAALASSATPRGGQVHGGTRTVASTPDDADSGEQQDHARMRQHEQHEQHAPPPDSPTPARSTKGAGSRSHHPPHQQQQQPITPNSQRRARQRWHRAAPAEDADGGNCSSAGEVTPQAVPAAVFAELFGSVSVSVSGTSTLHAAANSANTRGHVTAASSHLSSQQPSVYSEAADDDAASSYRYNAEQQGGGGDAEAGGSGWGPVFGRSSMRSYHNPMAADSISDAKDMAKLLQESLMRSDEAIARGRDQDRGSGSCGGGGVSEGGAASGCEGPSPQRCGASPDGKHGARRRRRWAAGGTGGGGGSAAASPAVKRLGGGEEGGGSRGVGSAGRVDRQGRDDDSGSAGAVRTLKAHVFENPLFASKAFDSPTASLG